MELRRKNFWYPGGGDRRLIETQNLDQGEWAGNPIVYIIIVTGWADVVYSREEKTTWKVADTNKE